MRFFVSFLRIDSEEPLLGLTTPQLVSVAVIPVALLLLAYFALRKEPEPASTCPRATVPPSRRRAAADRPAAADKLTLLGRAQCGLCEDAARDLGRLGYQFERGHRHGPCPA
jgi:hypothetical protein